MMSDTEAEAMGALAKALSTPKPVLAFDEEAVNRAIPRRVLEQEGWAGMIHLLADALTLWDADEDIPAARDAADKLREIAGPIN